jgi:hypothetical protein
MTIAICTHPQRCTDTDTAYTNVCGQLADAWREVAQLKAALVQARTEAQEWQDAYQGAVEGKAFYEGLFSERCKQEAK